MAAASEESSESSSLLAAAMAQNYANTDKFQLPSFVDKNPPLILWNCGTVQGCFFVFVGGSSANPRIVGKVEIAEISLRSCNSWVRNPTNLLQGYFSCSCWRHDAHISTFKMVQHYFFDGLYKTKSRLNLENPTPPGLRMWIKSNNPGFVRWFPLRWRISFWMVAPSYPVFVGKIEQLTSRTQTQVFWASAYMPSKAQESQVTRVKRPYNPLQYLWYILSIGVIACYSTSMLPSR